LPGTVIVQSIGYTTDDDGLFHVPRAVALKSAAPSAVTAPA
jgi:hypothetical protein